MNTLWCPSRFFCFLKATCEDCIYFWHKKHCQDLPLGPHPICKEDGNYDEAQVQEWQQQDIHILVGAVNSDHASNIKHCKSVSGIIVKLVDGAVLYKTAYQETVTQCSTESEFIATCHAGKYYTLPLKSPWRDWNHTIGCNCPQWGQPRCSAYGKCATTNKVHLAFRFETFWNPRMVSKGSSVPP